ncbi:MAG: primosomal protein N', partial [Planctomycetaceae bacterium]|nr:primosomal protein N' [Planctomycetaceae bacterium]
MAETLTHQQHLFETQTPNSAMPWEQAAEQDRVVASVVVNRPLQTAYSYLIPEQLRNELEPGQRVRVPFGKGNRLVTGYCVKVGMADDASSRLKWVHSVVDEEPLVSSKMLELTRWIADYYLCGWGQVLDGVIPQSVKRRAGTRVVKRLRLAENSVTKLETVQLSSKQKAVCEALQRAGEPLRSEEIRGQVQCGTGPIDALCRKGIIEVVRERSNEFTPDFLPVARHNDLTLNALQLHAVEAIQSSLQSQEHRTFLLHGVTGSGKTEVYIQTIREVVSYGKQAIVLVPEISLTPQTIERFRSRFDSVAVLHSHLSDAERYWHWQQIRKGKVQVIVGARSAVFAPAPHLGLIIIDEEHETSFKQDATPRYHTREVARQRAKLESFPLVLGSATPTLESWQRVKEKKDVLLSLPNRAESRAMPPVIVVDTRHDPQRSRGQGVGKSLQSAMKRTLSEGGQVILFLNLRGFSPTIWCRSCGVSVKCPHCDVTLTWHQDRKVCLCHVCDYQTTVASCPECERDTIRYLGIGTQRLEQEIRAKFPNHRVLRMDSDSMRRYGSYDEALNAFRSGEVQILLGTQMIAKGLDFPNVTLVGV